MSAFIEILAGGMFHAAVLFLVAAGLQLVFGVQKILNLACGSFYALGAYFGITAVTYASAAGVPPTLLIFILIGSGIVVGLVGVPIEWLLRPIYRRDESYQLLLTFGLLLVFQDVFRFFWGATPRTMHATLYLAYGKIHVLGAEIPTYNLLVIAASIGIAILLALFLQKTKKGRIIRATGENRDISEAMGVNVSRVFAIVFTLGTMLGTIGGALVVPTSAAVLDMGAELVVEAFVVVVIGGLGNMKGALVGAAIVGIVRAVAIATIPELELLSIYIIVIAVLVLKPAGLMSART